MGASLQPEHALAQRLRTDLPRVLPDYFQKQRWFGGKARSIRSTEVVETIPVPVNQRQGVLVLTDVQYADAQGERYAVPLILAGKAPFRAPESAPRLQLAPDTGRDATVCYDALWDEEFCRSLLGTIHDGRRLRGLKGELVGAPTRVLHDFPTAADQLAPSLMKAQQSNTSIRFGDSLILKSFRRLEEGTNPDLEIGEFLTESAKFEHTAPVAGALEYRQPPAPPVTLGILQAFVPNRGDAWCYTLDCLAGFFERVTSAGPPVPAVSNSSSRRVGSEPARFIGDYWRAAGLLGRRTAELHVALASGSQNPNFRPEPYSAAFQRAQYDSMRRLAIYALATLERRMPTLSPSVRSNAQAVLSRGDQILSKFKILAERAFTGSLIRIHGDFHLGQVLHTGTDFVIIDFEGEPARSLSERRAKRCPLQDVAGMLRSFHYATFAAVAQRSRDAPPSVDEAAKLAPWARYWQMWVTSRFLSKYRAAAAPARFLPRTTREFALLLDLHLLEKAVYELGYELNNRPGWVSLPLQGILDLLNAPG